MTNHNKANSISIASILFIVICALAVFNGVASGARVARDGKNLSAGTLRAMARVYMAYGEYAKAEPLAERALAFAEKNNLSDVERSLCLADLAYIYCSQAKLEQAREKCLLALNLQEEAYGENHPYSAYTLRILALVYQKRGDYKQAEAELQKAMDIMLITICLADSRAITPFQIDLANLYMQQGKYDEAESYFMKALPAISEAFGPEHLYTANVLGSVANLYVLEGKYSQAELMITQAVAVQEKIYGPKHYLIAPAWLTKANICWAKGDFVEAEELIQKALLAVEKTGNFTKLVVTQQRAAEIRSTKSSVHGLIATAIR